MAAVSLEAGDVDAALARERTLWEAYRTRDYAELERLIHPMALDVGPGGVRTRDEVLVAIAKIDLRAYAFADVVVRRTNGVEVVAYRSTVDGSYAGRPFRDTVVYSTSTWVAVANEWVLASRTECPLGG